VKSYPSEVKNGGGHAAKALELAREVVAECRRSEEGYRRAIVPSVSAHWLLLGPDD
jgi:hypothetical protein